MKKYLIAQVTQVSAWIGLAIILAAFFAPRGYIIIMGILLILTDDEALKNWLAKKSPWIQKKLDELSL